nr:CoF synthetase [uncultured Allomuricauda sp.]
MLKILEQVRKIAFWSLDALKGGNVRRHYKEIEWVQNNPSSDKSKQITTDNLSELLEHAVKTVPFYFDVSAEKIALEKFPVVNKQTVRDQFELFRSQPYIDKHNHQVLTSGSTGKPFRILHDKNKRDRNTADTLFFAKRAGFELGTKLYYLRLWDKQYNKNKIQSAVQNISAHSVDELNDENIAKIISEIENDNSSVSLLAYTSALDSICKYLDKHFDRPLKCQVSSAIAIAEALDEGVKDKVKKYFGVEVVSRYSNSENGILSQQQLNSDTGNFEINWASYKVEILDLNEDKPVELGESGRIVITDLFNYSMPLIRYDTGDVGSIYFDPSLGSYSFAGVEGRKMDMFTNTKGAYISSHIIHHILQFRGSIQQFQFIQEDNKMYVIKLKALEKLSPKDEDAILRQYSEYFGDDARIKIKYVKDIPLLPSGKRKLVINNSTKNLKPSSDSRTQEEMVDLVH